MGVRIRLVAMGLGEVKWRSAWRSWGPSQPGMGAVSHSHVCPPGDELEQIRPSVYRNVARQLHISLQSEPVVTDAFLAVAGHIFSAGRPQAQVPQGVQGRAQCVRTRQ